MRSINDWLNEYGESHKNPTNKMVHWICVPAIFWTIVGLFYGIKFPVQVIGNIPLNLAIVLLALTTIYYFSLSKSLSLGMLIFSLICLFICQKVEESGFTLWKVSIIVFVLAWIGQFWGHKVEGKKPSFLKDIQFLMIGPAWLMSFIYKKIGIAY
ncbi:Uncharacterized membrane protein YGL010W [Pseudarcicella hirudinis]|uniref:Uncharacterized membrane protein YGL010W n=1 Tax=Pseudarcicella hirudinis TaxID=1079859 RepID=A0A1I5S2H3_9BACT|nr:Mpo1-like protein [Pseudarcicella hirudinis]SFP64857.1 Uncharacterized membrane protein YGL010W [Pseudarcicella hirudinis]